MTAHTWWVVPMSCPCARYLLLNINKWCSYSFTDDVWEICFSSCITPLSFGFVCNRCHCLLHVPVMRAYRCVSHEAYCSTGCSQAPHPPSSHSQAEGQGFLLMAWRRQSCLAHCWKVSDFHKRQNCGPQADTSCYTQGWQNFKGYRLQVELSLWPCKQVTNKCLLF